MQIPPVGTLALYGVGLFLLSIVVHFLLLGVKPFFVRSRAKFPHIAPSFFLGNIGMLGKVDQEIYRAYHELMNVFPGNFCFWVFSMPFHVVTTPQGLRDVFTASKEVAPKNFGEGTVRGVFGRGLVAVDYEQWQTHRRMVSAGFTLSNRKFMAEQMANCAIATRDELLVRLKGGRVDRMETLELVHTLLMDVVNTTVFGLPKEHAGDLVESVKGFLGGLDGSLRIEALPWFIKYPVIYKDGGASRRRFYRAQNFMRTFVTSVIEKRLADIKSGKRIIPEERLDLLDLMLRHTANDPEDAPLSMEEIRDEVITFYFAGSDTSAGTLSCLLHELAVHPDVEKRVLDEIESVVGRDANGNMNVPTFEHANQLDYTHRVIKETLRLYPVAPNITRKLAQELVVDGVKVPPGTMLQLFIYGVHHRPELWEEPYRFDADRFLPENMAGRDHYAYVPFSKGHRNCIGENFAMLVMKIILCVLLPVFKFNQAPDYTFKPTALTLMKPKDGNPMLVSVRE